MTTENPTAGEGPVLLDIGGDVGALVVSMPEHTRGLEVEIRPAGATATRGPAHDHAHHDGHRHGTAPSPYPHVGVVERRTPTGTSLSLVYPSLLAGDYELCPLPGGDVVATASVVGGRVVELSWPG